MYLVPTVFVVFRVFYIYDDVICRDALAYFFIWIYFIPFSYLTGLDRISSIMLTRNGKSGNPCLVPDLRVKVISFSPLIMMLAVRFLYMAFIMLKEFPSVHNLSRVFS